MGSVANNNFISFFFFLLLFSNFELRRMQNVNYVHIKHTVKLCGVVQQYAVVCTVHATAIVLTHAHTNIWYVTAAICFCFLFQPNIVCALISAIHSNTSGAISLLFFLLSACFVLYNLVCCSIFRFLARSLARSFVCSYPIHCSYSLYLIVSAYSRPNTFGSIADILQTLQTLLNTNNNAAIVATAARERETKIIEATNTKHHLYQLSWHCKSLRFAEAHQPLILRDESSSYSMKSLCRSSSGGIRSSEAIKKKAKKKKTSESK